MRFDRDERPLRLSAAPAVSRPANLEDAAFWPVTHLARLIETRQVSASELTEMYLARLERPEPDPQLRGDPHRRPGARAGAAGG